MTPSTISKLERGEIVLGPVTLRKLAGVLPLTSDELDQLSEAAAEISARMKTSAKIFAEADAHDALCVLLLRAVGARLGVEEKDFFQGFGIRSGIWTKGYDFLIRLRDQTWLGFAINPSEVRVARTEVDDHNALPKPDGKDFETAGGVTLLLTPAHLV